MFFVISLSVVLLIPADTQTTVSRSLNTVRKEKRNLKIKDDDDDVDLEKTQKEEDDDEGKKLHTFSPSWRRTAIRKFTRVLCVCVWGLSFFSFGPI